MNSKVFRSFEDFKSFFVKRVENNSQSFDLVRVTPDIAAFLISNMSGRQRKKNTGQVIYLKNQIESGKWRPDLATIKIDITGHTCDGQHRLEAALESKQSLDMVLQFGFMPNDIHVIDSGVKPRSLGDIASMYYPEAKYIRKIPSAFAFIRDFEAGRWGTAAETGIGHRGNQYSTKPSPDEFLEWIDATPEFFEFISECERLRANGDKLIPSKTFCGLKWILDEYNPKKSDEFFTKLSLGTGLDRNHPIKCIRSVLIRQKTENTIQRLSGTRLITALIHVWNKFVDGEEMKNLVVPKSMPPISTGKGELMVA